MRALVPLAAAFAALGSSGVWSNPDETFEAHSIAPAQITEQVVVEKPGEPLFAAPTRLDRIGRILAPVKINGQGPFRLIVDTGANQSVLTTRLATRLGLEAQPERSIKLNGVTGSVMTPIVGV